MKEGQRTVSHLRLFRRMARYSGQVMDGAPDADADVAAPGSAAQRRAVCDTPRFKNADAFRMWDFEILEGSTRREGAPVWARWSKRGMARGHGTWPFLPLALVIRLASLVESASAIAFTSMHPHVYVSDITTNRCSSNNDLMERVLPQRRT
jgi:hypothetical protein